MKNTEKVNAATIARDAIKAKHGDQPANDIHSAMACPVCKTGVLHYFVAKSNGHAHAKCSNGTCVRFMT
jgi:hypothetical protein